MRAMGIGLTDEAAKKGLSSFMASRCAVRSQHKLPTEDEVLGTTMAAVAGVGRVKRLLEEMVSDGTLRRYGPYLSDRAISVL
jgi:hypothetical protein